MVLAFTGLSLEAERVLRVSLQTQGRAFSGRAGQVYPTVAVWKKEVKGKIAERHLCCIHLADNLFIKIEEIAVKLPRIT